MGRKIENEAWVYETKENPISYLWKCNEEESKIREKDVCEIALEGIIKYQNRINRTDFVATDDINEIVEELSLMK